MKNEKLFDAIGRIDDDLIEEAEHEDIRVWHIDFPHAKRYMLPIAAIFAFCIGIYSFCSISFRGSGSSVSADADYETAAVVAEDNNSIEEFAPEDADEVPAEAADEEESFILGSSCNEAAEESAAEVPALFVNGVEAYAGGWNCETKGPDGEWCSDISDSTSVLDCEGMLPVINADGAILLASENDMTFTAYCYPSGSYGADDAEKCTAEVADGELILPENDEGWIVVVTGTWNREDSRGSCEYFFEVQTG